MLNAGPNRYWSTTPPLAPSHGAQNQAQRGSFPGRTACKRWGWCSVPRLFLQGIVLAVLCSWDLDRIVRDVSWAWCPHCLEFLRISMGPCRMASDSLTAGAAAASWTGWSWCDHRQDPRSRGGKQSKPGQDRCEQADTNYLHLGEGRRRAWGRRGGPL